MNDPRTVRIIRDVHASQAAATVPESAVLAEAPREIMLAETVNEQSVDSPVASEPMLPPVTVAEDGRDAHIADLQQQLAALQQVHDGVLSTLTEREAELARERERGHQLADEVDVATERQTALAERLDDWIRQSWQGLEPVVAEIVAAALARLLGEGFDRTELLARSVRQAIAESSEQATVIVRLSLTDRDAVAACLDTLSPTLEQRLDVVADVGVADGDCFITVESTDWDVCLETRLLGIVRWLKDSGGVHDGT